MNHAARTGQFAPGTAVVATLLAALVGCGSSSSGSGGAGGSDTGGAGGSDTGGASGASTGGSSGSQTGGSGPATGGASGDTGGSMGTGGSVADASAGGEDAGGTGAGDAGSSAANPCPAKVTNYTLNNFPVADFCNAYEKYCQYTPDGSLMSKCGPGQKVGPLFKDRADCEMQYMMASAAGKACRAGQLCQNAPRGLIVNACSHATGYCAPTCGK